MLTYPIDLKFELFTIKLSIFHQNLTFFLKSLPFLIKSILKKIRIFNDSDSHLKIKLKINSKISILFNSNH